MRFAVVGDPIAHSLSPTIHAAAIAELGLPHTYTAIRIATGGFGEVARALRAGSLDGVNVTMPLKDEAFETVTNRSAGAERTRSVNTVIVDDGALRGENTDIDGVRYAVAQLGIDPSTPVTVLGTGGAARAAMVAMEDRSLTVMARSADRAAEALRSTQTMGEIVDWGTHVEGSVVINATPIGMGTGRGAIPEAVLEGAVGLIDMVYGHGTTQAVATMRDLGKPAEDGISMLVGQAVRAFSLFTGREAPVGTMMQAARSAAP